MADGSGYFLQFQELCEKILGEPSHNGKSKIISDFITGPTWKGDLFLLCKLLIIKDDQRVFHLREKSLTKLLSMILKVPHNDLLLDLQKGDLAGTCSKFFEAHGTPRASSILTLKQVDKWLDKLTTLGKEDEQSPHLASLLSVCTPRDLNFVVRLIDKDLNVNIGAKFVLNALHPQAFDAYRNTHNLRSVVDKVLSHSLDAMPSKKVEEEEDGLGGGPVPKLKKGLSIGLQVGTPIKPMLAKACKSFDEAWKRCPRGMYVEIKYDGERVQVHKQGDTYQFFSRNLKPVKVNKVEGLEELLSASTKAHTCILDGEVLVVDRVTLKMLPFSSLGVHKQKQFPNAQLCYFIFDIMHLDGKNTLEMPYEQRRQLLHDKFTLVSGRLALSDAKEVKTDDELQTVWKRVLTENLEGLMLKDKMDTYKPNQRHWLKLKKDYLAGMADSADLVVLGAYYGSGAKGGLLTTYLCCVFDPTTKTFKTTCKASGGLDDATLAKLQPEMMARMKKINGDKKQVPPWLIVSSMHCPDWVATDPKIAPVWEIEGTSFSISSNHTADGISIRFPRITKFRDDKDWSTATTLDELEALAMNSPDFVAQREMKGLIAPGAAAGASAKAPKGKATTSKGPGVSAPGLFETGDVSTLTTGKKVGLSGITYVVGNVTTGLLGDADSNRLIIVATDGSRWPTEEQAIVDQWPNVLKAFSKNKDGIEAGSALLVKIAQSEGTGTARLGVMVCIHPVTQAFSPEAMSAALEELVSFAKSNGISSVHFVWPASLKGASWSQIELKLKTHLVDAKCPVFVYSHKAVTGVTWKQKKKKKGLIVHDSDDELGSDGDREDVEDDDDEDDDDETALNPINAPGFGGKASVPPSFSSDPSDFFAGKSILSYGIPNYAELKALVLCDGGWFDSAETTAVAAGKYTHIVTEQAWDATLQGWLRANPLVKVVKPSWVFESSEAGRCVWEKPHFVPRVK
jgi:ATP-dependent DNA ligase I